MSNFSARSVGFAVLLAHSALAQDRLYYDLEVIAGNATNLPTIGVPADLGTGPSINDRGDVCFVARTAQPATGTQEAVLFLDGLGGGYRAVDTRGSRTYGDHVQINNRSQVAYWFWLQPNMMVLPCIFITGPNVTAALRRGAANGTLDYFAGWGCTIPATSGLIQVPELAIGRRPTLSSNGHFVLNSFSSNATVLRMRGGANVGIGGTSEQLSPMVADDGSIVVRWPSSQGNLIYRFPTGLIPSYDDLSDSQFRSVGRYPSISDDGTIAAWVGDRGNGPGLFVSFNTNGTNVAYSPPVRVLGESSVAHATPDLGWSSGGGAPIDFGSFDYEQRIGVMRYPLGRAGFEDDAIVLSFVGNPAAANAPYFSTQSGLFTVRLRVSGALAVDHSPAIPVVQLLDRIGGALVTAVAVNDPLAAIPRVIGSGTPTQRGGDHQVAFHVETTSGDLVLRGVHIDSDEDGLLDHWERSGIDVDGDGAIDWNPNGSPTVGQPVQLDPLRKDLLVESDALSGFAPPADALRDVVGAFASAPVVNTNGTTGIDLWVQLDETNLTPGVWPNAFVDFDREKRAHFGTTSERASALALAAKRLVTRYSIFCERFGTDESGGLGELGGNDFFVALGGSGGRGRARVAGVFMHELGHTLGLHHGGADAVNFKPNYFSVMNYLWTQPSFWGRSEYRDAWRLDYSRCALPDLDEFALDPLGISRVPVPCPAVDLSRKRVPIGPPGFTWLLNVCDASTFFGIGGILQAAGYDYVPMSGPVQWGGTARDVNFLCGNPPGAPDGGNPTSISTTCNACTVLRGHDDWSNLVYGFREVESFADSRHPRVPVESPIAFAVSPLGDCANGSLTTTAGAPDALLSVNGETTALIVSSTTPLRFELRAPSQSSAGASTPFAVYGFIGIPGSSEATPIPSAGTMCFPPCWAASSRRELFTLVNNVLSDPCRALLPSRPVGLSSPWVLDLPAGMGTPFTFMLQGLVELSPGRYGITNAVQVIVL